MVNILIDTSEMCTFTVATSSLHGPRYEAMITNSVVDNSFAIGNTHSMLILDVLGTVFIIFRPVKIIKLLCS